MDPDPVSVGVGRLLRQQGATVALAESCTGGRIAAALTGVEGASDYVWGCAVVYSAAAKAALLGLEPAWLEANGTVSEATTAALAEAVRKLAGSNYGLAATGWAGPEGGAEDDPVGTVYLGLATEDGVTTRRFKWEGDRETVICRATETALGWLRSHLSGVPEEAS